jgi:transcriptional regulator with XRE-family HTH domain
MIRFNLLTLLEKLGAKEGRKITLKEVSEKSGCDKNALSRIVNQPQIIPSANVIDKLAQFFFFELTRDEGRPHLDRNRMKSVIKDFISVYPDKEEFWVGIPESIRNRPEVELAQIWDMYTIAHRPQREKSPKVVELTNSIKTKLLEAERIRQAGGDIEISLTPEELDLLRDQLPVKMGGVKKNAN